MGVAVRGWRQTLSSGVKDSEAKNILNILRGQFNSPENAQEHPHLRPAEAVNCSAVGHHCLRRARPGPDFQDWKRETYEPCFQSWTQQDGLPHFDQRTSSVQYDPR